MCVCYKNPVKRFVAMWLLQDLLYRRGRALVDYENANKALDKARAKNRDVLQAETTQQLCCHKFEKISESAKQGEADGLLFGFSLIFPCFVSLSHRV